MISCKTLRNIQSASMCCSSHIHPEYIPKPRWDAVTDVSILRESLHHSAMRSSAIRRLPLPLPRFWQGLHFPFIVDIQRMSYFGKMDRPQQFDDETRNGLTRNYMPGIMEHAIGHIPGVRAAINPYKS